MAYPKSHRKKFAKLYHNNELSLTKTGKKWADELDYDSLPSSKTLHDWVKKYPKTDPNSNTEDDNMAKKESSDGLNKLQQVVKTSEVNKAKSNVNNDKQYQPGEKNETKNTSDKKDQGSSGSGIGMDMSKMGEFFSQHKKQIGLVLAGLVIVGVFVGFKRTINVEELTGHGSGNSGNDSSGNDGDQGGGSDLDQGWTGR